jgi:hypothetical protein
MIIRESYLQKLRLLKDQNLKKVIATFQNLRDGYPKYLLTMDFDNTNINGIQKINVVDWLLGRGLLNDYICY